MKINNIIIVAVLLFVSCNNDIETFPFDNHEISLSATVADMAVTRAGYAGNGNGVYTGESATNLKAAIWFSNTIGEFPQNNAPSAPTYIPCRTSITYGANPIPVYPINMSQPLTYPVGTSPDPVYCVGLHPADGWESENGNIATRDIDGNSDIMLAEQIMGKWDSPLATQQYKHLLTWLDLEMRATSAEAIEQWGKVKKVSVISPNSEVQIQFSKSADANGNIGNSTISYIGSEKELVALDDDSGVKLDFAYKNAGSLLCAPAKSYKLHIVTEHRTKDVEVTLKTEDYNDITDAKGKLFIINLYFTPYNDIDATCSLVPWNEQNIDIF